jgi:hypothetical protein
MNSASIYPLFRYDYLNYPLYRKDLYNVDYQFQQKNNLGDDDAFQMI